MKRGYVFFVVLFFVFSCKNEKQKNDLYFSNDFEAVNGWYSEPRVVKELSHSGNYCAYTDTSMQYSVAFSKTLASISDKALSKVDMSCWIKSKDTGSTSRLVISIDKDGKSSFWKCLESKDVEMSADKWAQLKGSFDLPNNVDPNSEVKIYLWNIGDKKVFLDDLQIQFL